MSDSEFDDNELDQMDHVTGPIEDAWKMKIPDFKPDDNKNGEKLWFYLLINCIHDWIFQDSSRNRPSPHSFPNTVRSTSTSAGRWCRRLSSPISSKPSWISSEARCRWRRPGRRGILISSSRLAMSSNCSREACPMNRQFVCSTMRSRATSSRSRIWWEIVKSSWKEGIVSLDQAAAL